MPSKKARRRPERAASPSAAPSIHGGTAADVAAGDRRRGDLPLQSPASLATDVVKSVVGKRFSRTESVVARYLDRLSLPMLELDDVTDKFDSWAEVADACTKVLGHTRSHDLAVELGYSARRVLAVAHALGYEPSDDE